MSFKPLPVLHVDGSLTEYVDKNGILHKVAGIGGYLVVNGKIIDRFKKTLQDQPCLNYHENHAIIEGLKWVKAKGYDTLNIRTDSMESLKLFTNIKKGLSKEDKFFLAQFYALEMSFDWVEIQYYSRDDDDLAHQLSRSYLKDVSKDLKELHINHKVSLEKMDYDRQNAELCTPMKMKRALNNSLNEIGVLAR